MHDKFVSGEDFNFINYAEIDNNEELDDQTMINRDAEDHYFGEQENQEYTGNERNEK